MFEKLKKFSKRHKEKGASMVELMAVLSTVTILVGGVSVKAGDVIGWAKDTQRIANSRQLVTVLQIYYLDNDKFPHVESITSEERWNSLISELEVENYLASFPSDKENYDYRDLDGSQACILKVLLEDSQSPYLENDWDGQVGGLDCDDPYYCIKM